MLLFFFTCCFSSFRSGTHPVSNRFGALQAFWLRKEAIPGSRDTTEAVLLLNLRLLFLRTGEGRAGFVFMVSWT